MPDAPNITWTISLDQANQVLGVLGKQRFDKVADLLMSLRQQAGEQLQRAQQMAAEAPPPGTVANGHVPAS